MFGLLLPFKKKLLGMQQRPICQGLSPLPPYKWAWPPPHRSWLRRRLHRPGRVPQHASGENSQNKKSENKS